VCLEDDFVILPGAGTREIFITGQNKEKLKCVVGRYTKASRETTELLRAIKLDTHISATATCKIIDSRYPGFNGFPEVKWYKKRLGHCQLLFSKSK
jgi:hypothetical protein